jgi:hypothetical protein
LPGRDEGVIGRLKMPGVVPVKVSASRCQHEEDKADHEPKRMPPHKPAAGLIPARTILLPTLFAFRRHFHDAPLARVARWRRRRACAQRIIGLRGPLVVGRQPRPAAPSWPRRNLNRPMFVSILLLCF